MKKVMKVLVLRNRIMGHSSPLDRSKGTTGGEELTRNSVEIWFVR